MVQARGLRRSGGAGVVVDPDRVQQLRSDVDGEWCRTLLDQAKPQLDVSEQPSFLRGSERRRRAELERPAGVVQHRGRDEQVGAQARVELRQVAADRGHGDGVLQQAARVIVVLTRRGGEAPQAVAEPRVGEEPADRLAEAGMGELSREELEEAVELVPVPPYGGGKIGGIGVCGTLERADVDLEPVAEALDPSDDANRVALTEAPIQELDVRPHARPDPAARVDELEGEVRRPGSSAQPLLAGNRVHALDDAVLG